MKTAMTYCTLGMLLAGTVHAAKEATAKEFYFEGVPKEKSVPGQSRVLPSETKVKKLSLFKNGYGYYTLSAKVPEDLSKTIAIRPQGIPNAVHGTFWIKENSKQYVSHIVSSRSSRRVALKSFSILDMALCNPGKKIKVQMNNNEIITGRISRLELSGEPPASQSMITEAPAQNALSNKSAAIEILPPAPEKIPLLCLDAEEGMQLIQGNEIKNIFFMETDGLQTPTIEEEVPVIEFHLKNTSKDTPIDFTCLSRGITWVPSYQIDLTEPEKAVFQAKTTIINELMDIDDAELELITGFPSLPFAHVPSPVGMRYSMDQFFQFLSGNPVTAPITQGTRIMMNQAMGKMDMGAMDMEIAEESVAYPTTSGQGLENFQSEDLFFYPIKRLSCAKNERVTFSLFSGKTPYSHLYTWDVPADTAPPQNRAYNQPPADYQGDVWHCIKITNSFPMPFTSAPVEFVSNGRIVGQNTLEFTPEGGTTTVKMNKSLEFKTDKTEKVISQTPKKDELDRRYVEIKVEGKLTLSNLTGKAVTVEITKRILGTDLKAENNADINLGKSYGSQYNLNGVIKWNLELQPKESKTLPYSYTFNQW